MPELNEKLLNRLGIADAMAHRAKATAGRLQQAAAKHHDAQNADIDALGKQIEVAGVGADEEAENKYCRALVTRGHMAQAHHLAGLDAARMPEVGASLEKGRINRAQIEAAGQGAMEFEENQHPRAAEGTAGQYKPGEFVPKGEQSDRVEAAAQSAEEDGHPGLAEAHGGGVTATPAFKQWFGESQVVGSDGKPLVVYHGSPEKIEKFDPDLIFSKSKRADYGFGFYFSPHFNHAQVFSAHTPKGRTQAELGHVHSVYLSIQKPWQADEPISRAEWKQFKQALPADGLLRKNPDMLGLIDSLVKDGPAEQNRKHALFHSVVGMDTPEIEKKAGMEIRQALMEMGYDGVHGKGIMGYDGTYGGEEWVAFQPEQIKSAGNDGTFDPNDPNINKAVRRTFHNPAQNAMSFDEEQHPREAKGAAAGRYKPGEFVPKGAEAADAGGASRPAQENGRPVLPKAHQDIDPKQDWKKNGVRSKSFKSWFGDWESDPKNASKVVDEDGEPQETYPFKVYHGTKQRFNTFDPEKLGTNTQHPTAALGFFFTESEVVARTFSGEKLRYEPEKDIRALAREHYGKEYADIQDEETRAKIRQMEKEQPKVVRSEGEAPARSHVLAAYLNLRNPYKMPLSEWMEKFARPFLQKDGKDKVKEAVAETRKKLEEAGYDGIILDKSPDFEDRPTNEYSARAFIAFRPEQIKSVDNEGTFDPSNPNMNKAVRSACEANELCRPFVPPDMPRWRGPRPSPNSYLPLNGVEDREKFLAMAKEMAAGTWTWDKPLIRCGDQLLTGSHRYTAAQTAGVPLETLDVDDLFKRCGRDFQDTWERLAQPYTSWINNLDAALKTLPPEILALFGIDLG